MKEQNKYDDIINLPHHQSRTRPHMSIYNRGAQFSPFAALTGYEDAVKETARLTNERQELSEERQAELSRKLTLLQNLGADQPEISITYFLPDEKKSGGVYDRVTGVVKHIDEVHHRVILRDQRVIPIPDIWEITGEIFDKILPDEAYVEWQGGNTI